MQKRLLIFILVFFLCGVNIKAHDVFSKTCHGRIYLIELALSVNDTDYINHRSKGLMLGDKVPDSIILKSRK